MMNETSHRTVAQLVERVVLAHEVAGSIPAGPAIAIPATGLLRKTACGVFGRSKNYARNGRHLARRFPENTCDSQEGSLRVCGGSDHKPSA